MTHSGILKGARCLLDWMSMPTANGLRNFVENEESEKADGLCVIDFSVKGLKSRLLNELIFRRLLFSFTSTASSEHFKRSVNYSDYLHIS